jgi:hypothetical protein
MNFQPNQRHFALRQPEAALVETVFVLKHLKRPGH